MLGRADHVPVERRPLIFVAKFIVNVIALATVQAVVIPLFGILSDVPLLASPAALLLVAAWGNMGIAAVGTLFSAVAARIGRDNLLVILVLPLVIPVLITAAEASRLLAAARLRPALVALRFSCWRRSMSSSSRPEPCCSNS